MNNAIKGIGNVAGNNSLQYGSKGKLKHIALIHNINTDHRYSLGDFTHELSHYWLMYIQDTPALQINRSGHWSHFIDTATRNAGRIFRDPNGGNALKDNGDGTFSLEYDLTPIGNSTSSVLANKFTSMDLYLMGLLSASDVQPLTLWKTVATAVSPLLPMVGTKQIITADDIVRVAGVRDPAYPNTQKNFKVGYILLPKQGETPDPAAIETIKWIADNAPQEWSFETGGRSTLQ